MILELISARDCSWADAEGIAINMWATFDAYPNEELPFTANPNDPLPHVQDAYNRAKAGEFGEIASFVPYVPTEDELSAQIRAERTALLIASDWTQLPDVPQSTKDLWAPYRQALRDVTAQSGFPETIEWPVAPQ
jgi:hypothetical protein